MKTWLVRIVETWSRVVEVELEDNSTDADAIAAVANGEGQEYEGPDFIETQDTSQWSATETNVARHANDEER